MSSPSPTHTIVAHLLSGASAFAVLVLWLCATSTWISPERWKWLGVMGLLYPLAWLGVVVLLVLTLLLAPRRAWIALLGLVSTWGFTMDYAPLTLFPPISSSADTTALKVVSYNTQFFGGWEGVQRDRLMDYLQQQRADVVCFQEGFPDQLGMRRVVRDMDGSGLPHFAAQYGSAASLGVFSRYPIVRQDPVARVEGNGIAAFWLTPRPDDTLLVVCCHLRSNLFTMNERSLYSQLLHPAQTHAVSSESSLSRRLMSKVARASVVRAQMVDSLVAYLQQHPDVPTVVCGDMNETPISYTHHRLTSAAGLTDVYRAAGSGIGRSFNKDAIFVRIDQGFCSSHFQPLKALIDQRAQYSDHYPLIMTLRRKDAPSH